MAWIRMTSPWKVSRTEPAHDGHVNAVAGEAPTGPVAGAGEADVAAGVGQAVTAGPEVAGLCPADRHRPRGGAATVVVRTTALGVGGDEGALVDDLDQAVGDASLGESRAGFDPSRRMRDPLGDSAPAG